MKFIYIFILLLIITFTLFAFNNNVSVLGEPAYYPIDPDKIEFVHTSNANRDFIDDLKLIGNSSYDNYPTSYNNWCMSYDEIRGLTYIAFTDCNDIDDMWTNRVISYNVINPEGEPMLYPEGEAEPTFAGYPDLITSVSGRPYIAFHKNDEGYYPWIKSDKFNQGGTDITWHDKVRPDFAQGQIWPQIRITQPTDGSEGIIYMMATDSGDFNSARICRATPVIDQNNWLISPFYEFENIQHILINNVSILYPSLAVSDDGSCVGAFFIRRSGDISACIFVFSTDGGETWSNNIELSYDNSLCDVDGDGEYDGNWTINSAGMHLFYNSLNEPCISYIKSVTNEGSNYYPFTSKVYFSKIDVENQQLIEHRVSDIIDTQGDITGGCCGVNTKSIAARVCWAGGGQNLAIAWIDSRNHLAGQCENSEIYYSISEDWGETWSTDVNISQTNTGLNDKDEIWLSVTPELSVDDNGFAKVKMMFMWDYFFDPENDHIPPVDDTVNEIYYYDFPVYLGISEPREMFQKTSVILHQNSPNPFNPTTNIGYELHEAGPVSLSIYNVKGQLVKKLIDDEVKALGSYSVVWDGKNSAGESAGSGVYFYKLETNNSYQMKKMLLIK